MSEVDEKAEGGPTEILARRVQSERGYLLRVIETLKVRRRRMAWEARHVDLPVAAIVATVGVAAGLAIAVIHIRSRARRRLGR